MVTKFKTKDKVYVPVYIINAQEYDGKVFYEVASCRNGTGKIDRLVDEELVIDLRPAQKE